MITLHDRNVNHLLVQGIKYLDQTGKKISPRGQLTLEAVWPVASVYVVPTERVLFNKVRDANPFFHFMEGLWILAGRNDVAFLTQFNKQMAAYSDDGETFHGAYGFRLRRCGQDQIAKAIQKLKDDPDTRQVVLQIWDHKRDLGAVTKDMPCNDMIFLKIRRGHLNMTVCNRSNDIIWGCYGANAVHFSMLQEYIAQCVGVEVGTYTQVSDSYHVYVNNPQWEKLRSTVSIAEVNDPYEYGVRPQRLVDDPLTFDTELKLFMDMKAGSGYPWKNKIFPGVALPMRKAWAAHKLDNNGATYAAQITADDWRLACLEWLNRRNDWIMYKNWGFTKDQMFQRGHRDKSERVGKHDDDGRGSKTVPYPADHR